MVLNHTGKACTVKLFSTAEYWVDQWRHAVRFAESVDMKYDMGIKIFLKVAPASVLSGMACRSLAVICSDSVAHVTVDYLARIALQDAKLFFVYCSSMTVKWKNFDSIAPRQKVHLPTHVWQKEHFESAHNLQRKAMMADRASLDSGASVFSRHQRAR